ncbi:MAG: acetyl-CoA acyltransferase, partial [Candidatus Marinamargulisbacteria bacterium]
MNLRKNRIAIIDGVRTPMSKVGGSLKDIQADDLGAIAVKEAMARSGVAPEDIDELILGNVAQPAHAANIARVVGLKAGLPISLPAFTVHRNCASGMEAITSASSKILLGDANIIVAGGTESMSNIPLLFSRRMVSFFGQLARARSVIDRVKVFSSFRLHFLKPVIGIVQGLTDPVSGLIMGLTAENLSREFHIGREAQDAYALHSHQKAVAAQEMGIFAEEMVPVPLPPNLDRVLDVDEGPRAGQSLVALAKLRPYFDRENGTVTVGNACPINDGAAAVILMAESRAKEMGLKPLGFLSGYAYAGLEPERMGLGPIYA